MLPKIPKINSKFIPKIEKKIFGDMDKDGRVNAVDCRPRNPRRQDLPITLAKQPIPTRGMGWSPQREDIRIHTLKHISPEPSEAELEHLGKLISHEELHKTLYEKEGMPATTGLDVVTVPLMKEGNIETAGEPVGAEETRRIIAERKGEEKAEEYAEHIKRQRIAVLTNERNRLQRELQTTPMGGINEYQRANIRDRIDDIDRELIKLQ